MNVRVRDATVEYSEALAAIQVDSEIAPYVGELVAMHIRRAYRHRGVGRLLIATLARRLR